MRLVSFSVENFRSITTARKIPLSDYSILVGANNEGKSNILHALALSMEVLSGWYSVARRSPDGKIIRAPARFMGFRGTLRYDWRIDYPISKQSSTKADQCSKVTLDFLLTERERAEFREVVGSSLNDTLPIQVKFDKDSVDVAVQKPGRGHATLNKKSHRIAAFVSERIRFTYIPAIRTSDSATRVISRLVERELASVEDNPDYIAALATIEAVQRPVFDRLAVTIKESISGFLPRVRSVELQPLREARSQALRRDVEVLIDDGSKTKLSRKGEGVQSLAALALMRPSEEEKRTGITRIIAIEEPESHLHPRAVHELRSVIESLSTDNQIVLTTHSPIFVKVSNISNTVIVKESRARPAEAVSEIRDALGVRFSDNLQNARLMLLVEGKDDGRALAAILSARSDLIRRSLADGTVAFDDLGGASSLGQKASYYRASACDIQCLLDDDNSGRLAVNKALSARAVEVSEVNLTKIGNAGESELEDLYDVRAYAAKFLEKFGVNPAEKLKSKKDLKWTDKTRAQFEAAGKPWNDAIKNEVKEWMSEFAAANPNEIVRASTDTSLKAFITSVEARLAHF